MEKVRLSVCYFPPGTRLRWKISKIPSSKDLIDILSRSSFHAVSLYVCFLGCGPLSSLGAELLFRSHRRRKTLRFLLDPFRILEGCANFLTPLFVCNHFSSQGLSMGTWLSLQRGLLEGGACFMSNLLWHGLTGQRPAWKYTSAIKACQ